MFLLLGFAVCLSAVSANAQDKVTVKGLVTDNKMSPLPGASVLVKGTTEGVVTDIDGVYEITVASNADLEIAYIGFITQTVNVAGRNNIKVVLEEDNLVLDAVVAIGYGSQRKEDLSMAISTMKVDKGLKSRASNLATVLQGQLPGVTIMQSGDPMSQATYSIRGRGSKGNDGDYNSGSGVLFVVDGVPNAPYMVEDIETITILKDAASAAIYGASVGSAGVVLITTKKPEGGKIKVDLNASFGLEQVAKLPEVLDAKQYTEVWAKIKENNPSVNIPGIADPSVYSIAGTTNTDWLDEIFKVGTKQHYAATFSGGSDKFQSVLSLSYDNNEGVLLNTWSKKFSGKLQSDFNLTKWLKIYERVSYEISNGQGNINTSHEGPIIGAIWYPRSAYVYETNADGTLALDKNGNTYFGGVTPRWAAGAVGPLLYNPVAQLTKMRRLYPENKIFSTTGVQVRPIENLTIKSEFTADLRQAESDVLHPMMDAPGLQLLKNKREQSFYRDNHWLSETTIAYNEVFGKHHVNVVGGFTADFKKTNARSVFTQGYASDDETRLLWTEADDYTSSAPTQLIYEYAMASFLGRASYSFDDRYFVTGSIRRDASSKLPASKNYDWFPAVSGSWKLSSEPFFKDSAVKSVLNLVKFRGGWGKVGNVDLYPNDVSHAEMLTYSKPAFFGKDLNHTTYGTYLSTMPNYNARWETTVQTSAGIDLGLFGNTLEVSVDWYRKLTQDLIDRLPVPATLGLNQEPMGNIGNVLNTGWETSINYSNSAANGQLTYNIYGNYSYNKGYVVDYGVRDGAVMHSDPSIFGTTILHSQAGEPWYSYLVYKTEGIFRSQDEIDNYTWTNPENGATNKVQPNAKPGDLKFADLDDNGKIDDNDKYFAGSYAPVHTFSFGGSLNFKGFDFSIMFQGVAGNKIYNGLKQLGLRGGNSGDGVCNFTAETLQTWDFDNQNSKYPRLECGVTAGSNGNYSKISDLFVEKGDYLRLKNITLGYTLPKFGKNMPGIRFYFSADNVCTFTPYTGIDPEVGNYGIDRGVYPLSRFFNFGVNLNF
ncbi:MAG: TonB-dependent receptor [Bacteroidales bacterium]|nr:TonB-dependent receptor [Bacteroidales bacterium]